MKKSYIYALLGVVFIVVVFLIVNNQQKIVEDQLAPASNQTIHGETLSAPEVSSLPVMAMQAEPTFYRGGQPLFDTNSEEYKYFTDNGFYQSLQDPLSTFSIDVDTAAYSNMRRFISKEGKLPPKDALRIEEMVNYFTYDYPFPGGDQPFSIQTELGVCPWNADHYLVMVGLQGKEVKLTETPPNNLVFLIDVSGSMNASDKLPLLKTAFKLLVEKMRPEDTISIVVYAGAAGVVLEPTSGSDKTEILLALDQLQAGGSTAGGEGIQLAYEKAQENFLKQGNNRVILATDGDFNVGAKDERELTELIEEKREAGIFLSVLGFGTGNYKDTTTELLANKGNGNYAYIDNILEAKKVLVQEIGGTLYTIAKDVKIQVEFNPKYVQEYRLIGYENRLLENEDFTDDTKDAGEMGAGHSVTAFYEIIPTKTDPVDQSTLKYQDVVLKDSDEWLALKVRYKEPAGEISHEISEVVLATDFVKTPSDDFLFASAVAEFGLILRDSPYKGEANFASILSRARQGKGDDRTGYRSEFIRLAEMAEILSH